MFFCLANLLIGMAILACAAAPLGSGTWWIDSHGLPLIMIGQGHLSLVRWNLTVWTVRFDLLAIPFAAPSGVWSAFACRRRWRRWQERRQRARIGICPKCGYDLRATRNRCPECGTIILSNESLRGESLRGSEANLASIGPKLVS
jgi:hypothetical protein